MNYLAHAYLSFGKKEILLGNLICDFAKGKKQFLYPTIVQKGILLHRAIDDFTDKHPVTHKARTVFKADYGLYSGAFVDVAYDHFLAQSVAYFPKEQSLFHFSHNVYQLLDEQIELIPSAFLKPFYRMNRENWLHGYSTSQGIHQSFDGLVKRAAYLQDSTRLK